MADIQMTVQEVLTQKVFTALMWALSYPGRIQDLPGPVDQTFRAIGETLIDLEVSYFTPDSALDENLSRFGGRQKTPQHALYQFYPKVDEDVLVTLEEVPVGTYLEPDLSATLILGASIGSGLTLRLSGPGIPETVEIQAGKIPPAFWSLRKEQSVYPLGWDVFLVDGSQVIGLPRTTQVEVL
jgi:alpha-D-ribose 1-methylphosphonate 5-triphosphate synthase subunit PhnH